MNPKMKWSAERRAKMKKYWEDRRKHPEKFKKQKIVTATALVPSNTQAVPSNGGVPKNTLTLLLTGEKDLTNRIRKGELSLRDMHRSDVCLILALHDAINQG